MSPMLVSHALEPQRNMTSRCSSGTVAREQREEQIGYDADKRKGAAASASTSTSSRTATATSGLVAISEAEAVAGPALESKPNTASERRRLKRQKRRERLREAKVAGQVSRPTNDNPPELPPSLAPILSPPVLPATPLPTPPPPVKEYQQTTKHNRRGKKEPRDRKNKIAGRLDGVDETAIPLPALTPPQSCSMEIFVFDAPTLLNDTANTGSVHSSPSITTPSPSLNTSDNNELKSPTLEPDNKSQSDDVEIPSIGQKRKRGLNLEDLDVSPGDSLNKGPTRRKTEEQHDVQPGPSASVKCTTRAPPSQYNLRKRKLEGEQHVEREEGNKKTKGTVEHAEGRGDTSRKPRKGFTRTIVEIVLRASKFTFLRPQDTYKEGGSHEGNQQEAVEAGGLRGEELDTPITPLISSSVSTSPGSDDIFLVPTPSTAVLGSTSSSPPDRSIHPSTPTSARQHVFSFTTSSVGLDRSTMLSRLFTPPRPVVSFIDKLRGCSPSPRALHAATPSDIEAPTPAESQFSMGRTFPSTSNSLPLVTCNATTVPTPDEVYERPIAAITQPRLGGAPFWRTEENMGGSSSSTSGRGGGLEVERTGLDQVEVDSMDGGGEGGNSGMNDEVDELESDEEDVKEEPVDALRALDDQEQKGVEADNLETIDSDNNEPHTRYPSDVENSTDVERPFPHEEALETVLEGEEEQDELEIVDVSHVELPTRHAVNLEDELEVEEPLPGDTRPKLLVKPNDMPDSSSTARAAQGKNEGPAVQPLPGSLQPPLLWQDMQGMYSEWTIGQRPSNYPVPRYTIGGLPSNYVIDSGFRNWAARARRRPHLYCLLGGVDSDATVIRHMLDSLSWRAFLGGVYSRALMRALTTKLAIFRQVSGARDKVKFFPAPANPHLAWRGMGQPSHPVFTIEYRRFLNQQTFHRGDTLVGWWCTNDCHYAWSFKISRELFPKPCLKLYTTGINLYQHAGPTILNHNSIALDLLRTLTEIVQVQAPELDLQSGTMEIVNIGDQPWKYADMGPFTFYVLRCLLAGVSPITKYGTKDPIVHQRFIVTQGRVNARLLLDDHAQAVELDKTLFGRPSREQGNVGQSEVHDD